ncbi:hypothetical protein F4809DRAFT_608222 [Biscogniauxia mediterranea]|nr:hypothetical protein F4809DRAFT_608222 [Biscogniauxia mediterranea]
MKVSGLASLLSVAVAVSANPFWPKGKAPLPTTTIAGVEVVDTQIVRDAQAVIRNMTSYLYKHQMRSWLFGAAMYNANETLKSQVDLEVHAIGTMLHDLGWDMTPGSPWFTLDHRFEVDGAIGARKFIRSHPEGQYWDEQRVQLVWDGIALHGTSSISEYKETDVVNIVRSIGLDYRGPSLGVTQEVYDAIVAEFPNDDLISGTNETFIFFCETKPDVTYDTWLQGWGEEFVPGYSAVGHRAVDMYVPK